VALDDQTRSAAEIPERAAIWIHGFPAKSWNQVVQYLDGDAHDQSKVQVLVGGKFYSLVLGEDAS
jgi:hypothetical protein